jgi:hypothetical protein
MRCRPMARSAAHTVKVSSDVEPIAAYKTILRDYIDRRPAGMRTRIASALGKHKSFVSQLTNPVYPMPIPARHIETIFEICHFSPEERRTFLKAYARAHPERRPDAVQEGGTSSRRRTISLEVPELGDPRKQRELEGLLREFAERICKLLE